MLVGIDDAFSVKFVVGGGVGVDGNNDDIVVVVVVLLVVVVVVVVVVIFDDLGLFQSPKRLQAFFHLH